MTVRTLRWPDERNAVLEFIRLVYGEDDYHLMAETYGQSPAFNPADCLVIDGEAEGEIAGHALIVPRQLQTGASQLPAAEISLFGVSDAYQGRGYEQDLLRAAHDRMTIRGDALGLSFGQPDLLEPWFYEYAVGLYLTNYESDITTDLAQRAGRWNLTHGYERRTADRLGARNQAVEIRRFYASDLPAVHALYTAESARGHYLVARSETTWAAQLDYLTSIGRYDPDDFLVAEVGEQLVAYVRLVTQAPVNTFRESDAAAFSVIEAGGDHPDGIEALLGEVGRLAQTFDAQRIGLFVHPESAFMRHALARGASLRHFTGAGLVRLHNLALALDLLRPTFERRMADSRFADRACCLMVTTEDEQAQIEFFAGGDDVIELEVPSAALVRLITGWHTIDHLMTGYHETHAELLRALFPPRDPKIGLADVI
jgi:predicted N-acetyltransferase YhbS